MQEVITTHLHRGSGSANGKTPNLYLRDDVFVPRGENDTNAVQGDDMKLLTTYSPMVEGVRGIITTSLGRCMSCSSLNDEVHYHVTCDGGEECRVFAAPFHFHRNNQPAETYDCVNPSCELDRAHTHQLCREWRVPAMQCPFRNKDRHRHCDEGCASEARPHVHYTPWGGTHTILEFDLNRYCAEVEGCGEQRRHNHCWQQHCRPEGQEVLLHFHLIP